MGTKKPANPLISLLAVMSLLMVLFGFFREVAHIQSENAKAQAHHAYKQLSFDTRTNLTNKLKPSTTPTMVTSAEQVIEDNSNDDSIDAEQSIEQAGSEK